MGMSEFYGEASRPQAVATLRRAVDLGVTLFDTADMYGQGDNERLLGEALGSDRDRVVIATKFGLLRDAGGAFTGVDGTPRYAREACERSLERLGVTELDLFQLHRVDPEVPIEETVGAMHELVTAGKVRRIGLSEVTAEQLRRAASVAPIATVQSEYSLLERAVEREVLPECERLGIAFLAFAPLMRGLIAHRFDSVDDLDLADNRRRGAYPRLQGDALAANLELARVIWGLADEHAVPPSQIALAWLLRASRLVIPIPGAKRLAHLEQNVGALGVELSAADLERLDAVVGRAGSPSGERLPRRAHNRGVADEPENS
jgi:aryl-alcohol dehydrogenase-like predicted oxidoreductase